MPKDPLYLHLLAQCQSPDLGHRLGALEDLRQHEYLDLVSAQFLLDRLNSTLDWQEQTAILGVFAFPPETVYSFRGEMQKPPITWSFCSLSLQRRCSLTAHTIPIFTPPFSQFTTTAPVSGPQ
jgi:hypothetical protein